MITEKRKQRFQDVINNRLQDVVVLENIHDPHNALASIRNCDAFGVQTAHFVFETEKIFSPDKLGKLTSASANKWLETVTWSHTADCLNLLKKQGFRIVSTIIDLKAKRLHDVDFSEQKTALIFGNEGFGISKIAKDMSDELIYIPMNGFVDSLNLSVSVGVVLYELSKQRQNKKECYLSNTEKNELFEKWVDDEIKKKCRL